MTIERRHERRERSRAIPWQVVVTGSGPTQAFLAVNARTGRSVRLPVAQRHDAERYVAVLNRSAVELRA